jgi:hypothetical protein
MKQQLNNNSKQLNLEKWMGLDKDEFLYWVDSSYFGYRKVDYEDRPRFDSQTILITATTKKNTEVQTLVCSFHHKGHGFYYEKWDYAESMQVYKATENRDYYYRLIELHDKTTNTFYSKEWIYTKHELIQSLIKYFDQLQSSFENGKDDSVLNSFYEFINGTSCGFS